MTNNIQCACCADSLLCSHKNFDLLHEFASTAYYNYSFNQRDCLKLNDFEGSPLLMMSQLKFLKSDCNSSADSIRYFIRVPSVSTIANSVNLLSP